MKQLLIMLFIFNTTVAYSQTIISGKVVDQRGKGIAAVSITIRDSYDGATTDSLGNFSFSSLEKGVRVLGASISGYSSYNENITLEEKTIELKISLKELVTELNAVTITAGSFEAGDKKKTTVLTSLDIVTTASAEGDITGALKTLPGTQQVGEEGGLFVRGGSATEAKIYIDGTLVNNFFYSSLPGIASRGRFNPFLFKGTVFSSGGYSALYGQALSSALILESTDLPDQSGASIGLSVIGVNAGIQKLTKNKKASWGGSYSFSHLGLAFAVIKQKQDYFKKPVFHEGDLNFRIKTKNGGIIKYFGYWSLGKLGYRVNDIDSAALKNSLQLDNVNIYQNITWRSNLGKGWKSQAALSFSTDKQDIANQLQDASGEKQHFQAPTGYQFKNFDLNSRSYFAQARLVMDKRLNGMNMVRFGSDYFYSNEKSTFTLFDGTTYDTKLADKLFAAFAESDFYASNSLAVKIGTRLEHSQIMDRWNVAPRVSLAYKLGKQSQASFAYGIFYQNPESRYQPAAANIGFSKASHYILQYQKIAAKRSFRAELFYKNYDNLYKTAADNFGREIAVDNDGYGSAKGIEFFWRDKETIKNMDYWISYSFLDTKRNHLNFPTSMEPNFAAKHTSSLVLKKFVSKLKMNLNASYNFATGRPYYNLRYDANQAKYIIADAGRTINYNALGFSVNYLPNIGKKDAKGFSVLVLSVSNVLGQKQVFNYRYGTINHNKEAIGPTAKRFVFIGWFMSFGIDQTENVINNNL